MSVYRKFPYKISTSLHGYREGFYLKNVDDNGNFGVGEVAFFQGLEERSVKSYAHDMIRKHLLWKKSKPNIDGKNVKLSALVDAYDIDLAKKFIDTGYGCLKIKISANYFLESIKIVNSIMKLSHNDIKIRLDANRSFTLKGCQDYLRNIDTKRIEYFEEPLVSLLDVPLLLNEFSLPIAADESWSSFLDIEKFSRLGVKVFIIKPSRFFSLDNIKKNILKIKQYNGKTIFSTCFESEYFSCFSAMMIGLFDLIEDYHGIYCPAFFTAKSFLDKPTVSLKKVYDYLLNFDCENICHF